MGKARKEETMNNPYKTLGVSENASQEEIRAAYLALVKKYHPDKYRDNPLKELANEKLKEINEAYDVLTKKELGFVDERVILRGAKRQLFTRTQLLCGRKRSRVFKGKNTDITKQVYRGGANA